MAWEIGVIPLTVLTVNIIKYISEAVLDRAIILQAQKIEDAVSEDRLPNSGLTSKRLWTKEWIGLGEKYSRAFSGLLVLLHIFFFVFEFAFDSGEYVHAIQYPTEAPTRRFEVNDTPLNFGFREATNLCTEDNINAITSYRRPRKLLKQKDPKTGQLFYPESIEQYGHILFADDHVFSCPKKALSSILADEAPYKIGVFREKGPLQSNNTDAGYTEYLPKYNISITVYGMKREVAQRAFESFSKETCVSKDRDPFVAFWRFHLTRFVWADLKRTNETLVVKLSPGTSVRWAVLAILGNILLLFVLTIILSRAKPIEHEKRSGESTDSELTATAQDPSTVPATPSSMSEND